MKIELMKHLVLLSAIFLTSCIIPVTGQVHLGEDMKARVIDSASGMGIAGALVKYKGFAGYETSTDADGYFLLKEQLQNKRYWMPPAPVDPPPWFFDSSRYVLVINAPGYAEREFERVKTPVFLPPKGSDDSMKGPEYFLFPLNAIK